MKLEVKEGGLADRVKDQRPELAHDFRLVPPSAAVFSLIGEPVARKRNATEKAKNRGMELSLASGCRHFFLVDIAPPYLTLLLGGD